MIDDMELRDWSQDDVSPHRLGRVAARLERELPAYLPGRRWFGAKGRRIAKIGIVDLAQMGPATLLALADVTLDGDSEHSLYQIPVGVHGAEPEIELEGLLSPEGRRRWLDLIVSGANLPGVVPGTQTGFRFEMLRVAESRRSDIEQWATNGASSISRAEQSNTSIIYRDSNENPRALLKVFRQLAAGPNPELEVPLALAGHTTFRRMPLPLGRVQYGRDMTLATLQEFVPNSGDGWEYMVERCRKGEAMRLLPDLRQLGRRTAELHAALAAISWDESFAPATVTASDIEQWRAQATREAKSIARELSDAELPRFGQREIAERLQRYQIDDGLDRLAGSFDLARIHGDYHLGQVLVSQGDFIIFDFEGEPARPLTERRRKHCVLKDVAGMLRSFGYAAHAAGVPEWIRHAREAFLEAYFESIDSAPRRLVPSEPAASEALLAFFEREKAVYELGYEFHHRPDWVEIPLQALDRLLPKN